MATAVPTPNLADMDDPNWGCGLLGYVPGINKAGEATAETQKMVDGLKGSSTFNKVSYWNWNLAPEVQNGKPEYLTEEFIFMPDNWGVVAPNVSWVRQAGVSNYLDGNGVRSKSTMATIFLGANEPDIQGSCQIPESTFGHCVVWNQCLCQQATGVGFWPLKLNGCSGVQPLPGLWSGGSQCIDVVMQQWAETWKMAVGKGYKYLSTPMVATNMKWGKTFLERACGCTTGKCACTDASCGCPVYFVFHFYAYDCQPDLPSGYAAFQAKVDAVKDIMEEYPFVKGAIVNEVGILNCAGGDDQPICIPNNGKYPASSQPGNACPNTVEIIKGILDIVRQSKTSDGRDVVKGLSWFNQNEVGGTYNLRLFNDDGTINAAGNAYIEACQTWANRGGETTPRPTSRPTSTGCADCSAEEWFV